MSVLTREPERTLLDGCGDYTVWALEICCQLLYYIKRCSHRSKTYRRHPSLHSLSNPPTAQRPAFGVFTATTCRDSSSEMGMDRPSTPSTIDYTAIVLLSSPPLFTATTILECQIMRLVR